MPIVNHAVKDTDLKELEEAKALQVYNSILTYYILWVGKHIKALKNTEPAPGAF